MLMLPRVFYYVNTKETKTMIEFTQSINGRARRGLKERTKFHCGSLVFHYTSQKFIIAVCSEDQAHYTLGSATNFIPHAKW